MRIKDVSPVFLERYYEEVPQPCFIPLVGHSKSSQWQSTGLPAENQLKR